MRVGAGAIVCGVTHGAAQPEAPQQSLQALPSEHSCCSLSDGTCPSSSHTLCPRKLLLHSDASESAARLRSGMTFNLKRLSGRERCDLVGGELCAQAVGSG
eukprot:216155-Rhodomonas_salina.1